MLVGSLWELDLQKMYNSSENTNPSTNQESILDEVISALSKNQKELPCKYFYDNYGSDLFDQITELEEYYLTRSEISILNENIDVISRTISSNAVLIELGSGSSKKIRIILDHLESPEAYIPVEISEEYLLNSIEKLKFEYPSLNISPVIADYTRPFELPKLYSNHSNKVVYYPGSTIGNFNPETAASFLKRISELCGAGSSLLIGVDLKKDIETIEKAYNDEKGITKEFNLNILKNLNEILGSDFNISKWDHNAFYNVELGRIEMHLVSTDNQKVNINGTSINFSKGETIHTENSYKFTVDEFEALISSFYNLKRVWKDVDNNFALCYFKAT